MGIKGLWTVFAPYCEKKSLHEIEGETLAVDLSGWVCDSQNVTDYCIQPKLYLRNLFFRTVYLLLADIKPIFVLEGDAPELKRDVMAARNAIQFRGAPTQSTKSSDKPDVARRRFKTVLKECETLLKSMGVRCIKGSGEAEATCAQLNAQGVVDAVISQDSDCFAYGARRVYRNFSVSNSGGGGALQGSVDCYDADVMLKSNGFGRKKMVALALLCGCDYGAGACGSSINTVVSFLHTVPDDQIIHRLISWVSDSKEFEERGRWVSVPGRCDRCGHAGRTHAKTGCPVCATPRGCEDKGHKARVAEVKRELSLRTRALSCGMPFPEPKVMKEFLKASNEVLRVDCLDTPVPSLIQFMKIMCSKLDWTERYCVEKFLPILTKWHLQDTVTCRKIKPKEIKKKRNPKGVPSYEVVWNDINGEYDGLIPDDQFEADEDTTKVWTSIERQDLMRKYYPELVELYEESIKKPAKVKKTRQKKDKENRDPNKPKKKYNRKKKTVELEAVNNSLRRLSLDATDCNTSRAHVSISVTKLKRKIKNTKTKSTIDSYFKCKKRKFNVSKVLQSDPNYKDVSNSEELLKPGACKAILNLSREIETGHRYNLSFFNSSNEEVDVSDLSDIVDTIVTRGSVIKTASVNNNLVKLIFENKTLANKSILQRNFIQNNCSTPKSSPVRKKKSINLSKYQSKVNTSYFFDKLTDGGDAPETSLSEPGDRKYACNSTVDCSLPDVNL